MVQYRKWTWYSSVMVTRHNSILKIYSLFNKRSILFVGKVKNFALLPKDQYIIKHMYTHTVRGACNRLREIFSEREHFQQPCVLTIF